MTLEPRGCTNALCFLALLEKPPPILQLSFTTRRRHWDVWVLVYAANIGTIVSLPLGT